MKHHIIAVLIVCLLVVARRSEAQSQPGPMPETIVIDCMSFKNKPMTGVLGRQSAAILYEHETTMDHDPGHPATGGEPSAFTIEHGPLRELAQRKALGFEYAIIDIESLPYYAVPSIAKLYLDEVKAATGPSVKWAWWNVTPPDARFVDVNNYYFQAARGIYEAKTEFVQSQDFIVLGWYFQNTDTLQNQDWWRRHGPQLQICRRVMRPDQKLFVTLSPHPFNKGRDRAGNWQHASGDLLVDAMHRLHYAGVDGIWMWSTDGNRWKNNEWDQDHWGDWPEKYMAHVEPARRTSAGWQGGLFRPSLTRDELAPVPPRQQKQAGTRGARR